MQLQFLVVGTHAGTRFQLACLRSLGGVSVKKEQQGHNVLRVILPAKLA